MLLLLLFKSRWLARFVFDPIIFYTYEIRKCYGEQIKRTCYLNYDKIFKISIPATLHPSPLCVCLTILNTW